VILYGTAEIADDVAAAQRVDAALSTKYADFLAPTAVPEATRRHYAAPRAYIRITPTRPALTWDNARIRPRATAR